MINLRPAIFANDVTVYPYDSVSIVMQPIYIQRIIALPYLVLGSWCLIAPVMVERMMFNPAYQHLSPTSALLIGCFGAQAILGGLFIWFSRFTRRTFLAYALALLPFFGFNYWFVYEVPIFNRWMILDFGANVAMLALSLWGWHVMDGDSKHTIIMSR